MRVYLFILLIVLLAYNDYMVRMAQIGFIDGYIEGMETTKVISLRINAYDPYEFVRVSKAIEYQTMIFQNNYIENGGSL